MTEHSALIKQIVDQVKGNNGVSVLLPATIGDTPERNELVMFVKPEIFLVEQPADTTAALEMIFAKLDDFEARIDGIALVGGQALEEKEIMNRHYGFINEMSRKASTLIDAADRKKIEELLGVSLETTKLYGGHEFLKAHPKYDAFSLDALWFTKKSLKVRSGFYVQTYEADGETFVLVNGFHPVQLAHFTDPTHRILLLLIHSDTDWSKLRNDLIGVTFPEKADPGSIRGTLFLNPHAYGFEKVDIGNNGVHLSAGPYEGVVEIINFFGNLLNLDTSAKPPLAIRKLVAAGLTPEQALGVTKNPTVTKDGKQTDLFSATEDVNTDDAVRLYVDNVR